MPVWQVPRLICLWGREVENMYFKLRWSYHAPRYGVPEMTSAHWWCGLQSWSKEGHCCSWPFKQGARTRATRSGQSKWQIVKKYDGYISYIIMIFLSWASDSPAQKITEANFLMIIFLIVWQAQQDAAFKSEMTPILGLGSRWDSVMCHLKSCCWFFEYFGAIGFLFCCSLFLVCPLFMAILIFGHWAGHALKLHLKKMIVLVVWFFGCTPCKINFEPLSRKTVGVSTEARAAQPIPTLADGVPQSRWELASMKFMSAAHLHVSYHGRQIPLLYHGRVCKWLGNKICI